VLASKGRLLVVDDYPPIRALLSRMIETWGYECGEAPDGLAALRCLACQGVSLVVTDYRMPRLDGLGLLQSLFVAAGVNGQPMLPVVVLSTGVPPDVQGAMWAAGARAVLSKPVDPVTLRQEIERLMRPPSAQR
jgi:CheY-like chemotaxis protein